MHNREMLDRIKNQIGRNKTISSDDFVRIHHEMMKVYGWIPFNEFKMIPLPTLFGLWGCIQEDRKNFKENVDRFKKDKSMMLVLSVKDL